MDTEKTLDADIVEETLETEHPPQKSGRNRSRGKKGGFFGKLIAFLLSFVLGAVGGIAGLAGVVYYFAKNKTIKQTATTIQTYTGFTLPLSDYLTEAYINKTIWGALTGSWTELKKIGDGKGTLNDLNAISPQVEKLITCEPGLLSIFRNLGIKLDGKEVMSKFLVKPSSVKGTDTKYFTDYLMETFKGMPLGDFLKKHGYKGNKLMDALIYGVIDEDYTKDSTGNIQMNPGKEQLTLNVLMSPDLMDRFNNLPIDALMEVSPTDNLMCSVAYGKDYRYTATTEKVTMNQVYYMFDPIGNCFVDPEGEKLSPTPVYQEDGVFLLTLSDGTKQLLKLSPTEPNKYLLFTNEEEPQPIKYSKVRYGDLTGEGGFQKIIDDISLADALGVNDGSHAVIKAIAYDDNGNERTVGDFKQDGKNIINDIKLSTVLPADQNSTIIMYMLYGKKGVHYTIEKVNGVDTVIPLQQRVALHNGMVFNAYGEQIAGAVPSGTTSYKLGDVTYTLSVPDPAVPTIKAKWTKSLDAYAVSLDGVSEKRNVAVYEEKVFNQNGTEIKNAVANGTTSYTHNGKTYTLTKNDTAKPIEAKFSRDNLQAYYVSLDGEALMYKEATIGALEDGSSVSKITDRLSVGEFIDVGEHRLLKSLGNSTIAELPDDINNLTIEEIFGESFYYRTNLGKFRLNENDEFIDDKGAVVVPEVGGRIYLVDIEGIEIDLDGDKNVMTQAEKDAGLTGSWKYILKSETTGEIKHNTTLLDMDHIMDNLLNSIHDAEIRELHADGIVTDLNDTTLKQQIVTTILGQPVQIKGKPVNEFGETIGELTIEELMLYTAALLAITSPSSVES